MLNYWWVTRPKRKLNSVPDVLATFADISLNQEWQGQRDSHLSYEEALERAGLKRKGDRRDQTGGGARTYKAWLVSLGLIFEQAETKQIRLTLAGEAIMAGESPVQVLSEQIMKYQFPSAFSIGRGVQVHPRFKIHPFRFLLRLLMDERVAYLTEEEIAKVIVTEAENETEKCYNYIVNRISEFRQYKEACLEEDFFTKYKPSRGEVNPDHPYSHLLDLANTLVNWLDYTQLIKREDGKVYILFEKRDTVCEILNRPSVFINRPDDHEFFQRKYGLDPKHKKDTRNLTKTQTITAKIIAQRKINQEYIKLSLKKPIARITRDVIDEVAELSGFDPKQVEDVLQAMYPHGSIGGFMSNYFEMAFKGRDEAIDFEKATTILFRDVFGFTSKHLGQTGSLSAPDVLLLSDSEGYQAIIDNKAYSAYSISGDHKNRMIHNYIEQISNYSPYSNPIGFFSYISGGFGSQIDRQIKSITDETGVNGSGITVSNFIDMIDRHSRTPYSHADIRQIFGVNRQIVKSDYFK